MFTDVPINYRQRVNERRYYRENIGELFENILKGFWRNLIKYNENILIKINNFNNSYRC